MSVPVGASPHSGPVFWCNGGLEEGGEVSQTVLSREQCRSDHKRYKDSLVRWDPGPAYGSASGIEVPLCIGVDSPCATLGSH